MERFILGDVFDSDNYTTTYEAYDKKTKCWCYVEVPKRVTSWKFQVFY